MSQDQEMMTAAGHNQAGQDAANKSLMLRVMRAFRDGDLEPLFAAVSDDIVWTSNAPPDYFRFGGTHHGRTGMREFTALFASRYHFVRLEAKAILGKGEIVHGLYEAEIHHRPSDKTVKVDIAIRWVVRDGRIVEHQGFFDTASVLIQQGDLPGIAA